MCCSKTEEDSHWAAIATFIFQKVCAMFGTHLYQKKRGKERRLQVDYLSLVWDSYMHSSLLFWEHTKLTKAQATQRKPHVLSISLSAFQCPGFACWKFIIFHPSIIQMYYDDFVEGKTWKSDCWFEHNMFIFLLFKHSDHFTEKTRKCKYSKNNLKNGIMC